MAKCERCGRELAGKDFDPDFAEDDLCAGCGNAYLAAVEQAYADDEEAQS